MNVILGFVKIAIGFSGLASSVLFSFLIFGDVWLGKRSDALMRQAGSFLALFAVSVMVYLVLR